LNPLSFKYLSENISLNKVSRIETTRSVLE
jgi:tRNA G37 N-methylase Trm5